MRSVRPGPCGYRHTNGSVGVRRTHVARRALISFGRRNAKDADGKTALDIAIEVIVAPTS